MEQLEQLQKMLAALPPESKLRQAVDQVVAAFISEWKIQGALGGAIAGVFTALGDSSDPAWQVLGADMRMMALAMGPMLRRQLDELAS